VRPKFFHNFFSQPVAFYNWLFIFATSCVLKAIKDTPFADKNENKSVIKGLLLFAMLWRSASVISGETIHFQRLN
jgi:hypothetical protein